MKAQEHFSRITALRKEIIEEIKSEMINKKAQQITLRNRILFIYIDEQVNEVIDGLTLDGTIFIDREYEIDSIPIDQLSTDQLITLLEVIENDEFDIDILIEGE